MSESLRTRLLGSWPRRGAWTARPCDGIRSPWYSFYASLISLPALRGIFPRTLSGSPGPGNGIPMTRMLAVACPLHGPVIRVRGDRELRSMNRFTRRAALVGASALPFAAAGPVRAQAKFPDRPIRLIIPWAAGGPADAGFRILAQSVSKKLGQQVIVDNKAGASGIMGAMVLQCDLPLPISCN